MINTSEAHDQPFNPSFCSLLDIQSVLRQAIGLLSLSIFYRLIYTRRNLFCRPLVVISCASFDTQVDKRLKNQPKL